MSHLLVSLTDRLNQTESAVFKLWMLYFQRIPYSDYFDDLSLVGPTVVQLLDVCCSSVSVLVLLLNTDLASSLESYVYCLDALLHADQITCKFMNYTST